MTNAPLGTITGPKGTAWIIGDGYQHETWREIPDLPPSAIVHVKFRNGNFVTRQAREITEREWNMTSMFTVLSLAIEKPPFTADELGKLSPNVIQYVFNDAPDTATMSEIRANVRNMARANELRDRIAALARSAVNSYTHVALTTPRSEWLADEILVEVQKAEPERIQVRVQSDVPGLSNPPPIPSEVAGYVNVYRRPSGQIEAGAVRALRRNADYADEQSRRSGREIGKRIAVVAIRYREGQFDD